MKYKTCVSIAEKTPKKMKQALAAALKKSEYAEMRLDFLRPVQVPDALDLAKKSLKRCVCTLRPKTEGGVFSGTEKERVSILKLIAEYRPYRIDIELSTMSKNKDLVNYVKKTKTVVLVSWHDFDKTPKTLEILRKWTQMKKYSRHVKIVTVAKTMDDVYRVLSLYGRLADSSTTTTAKSGNNSSLIAFTMGQQGRISRILCLYLGSPYTYVSMKKAVAAGQFSVDEVRKITSLR